MPLLIPIFIALLVLAFMPALAAYFDSHLNAPAITVLNILSFLIAILSAFILPPFVDWLALIFLATPLWIIALVWSICRTSQPAKG